ncbi:MAG: DUF2125 domain-containing protein [Pseudomonadota bacterium]
MRTLLIAIIVAGLGWSGYWWFGADATDRAVERWLNDRQSEGWVANYETVKTRGFPNRFDTTIYGPELADPDTGVLWQTEFVQFLRLSYRPHHMIAVWPDEQTFGSPEETVTLSADGLRGSLKFEPGLALTLEEAIMESGPFALSSTADWDMRAQSGLVAVRQTPAHALTYDFAVNLRDLAPPDAWMQRLGQAGVTVGDLGRAELEATVKFDAPWDLDALENARPQPQRIDLSEARIQWGDMTFAAAGELDVDSLGRLDGALTVRAGNWQAMLNVAESTGLLPRDLARLVGQGLTFMARFGGNPNRIDTELTFNEGVVSLGGFVPLGQAPRLVIR